MLTVGSLFAGIGGFDLGFERAGCQVRWQVEIDPYAQAVLAKHWPAVVRYGDIRTLRGADVEPVDVLCGGFPCQDISVAGAGAGIDGERSGLWGEYARLIGELRPRYVVVENVSALLVRGMGRVLGDLATCGYDAEWDCLPASAFGAPHQRDRVWLVAYPNASGRRTPRPNTSQAWTAVSTVNGCSEMANASGGARQRKASREGRHAPFCREGVADADDQRQLQPQGRIFNERGRIGEGGWWRVEPDVGRVAYGIPNRVDRLKGLGNAIVPQIAEWIARRILEVETGRP